MGATQTRVDPGRRSAAAGTRRRRSRFREAIRRPLQGRLLRRVPAGRPACVARRGAEPPLGPPDACVSNALRLDSYIEDADRAGDGELAEFFRRAQARAQSRASSCSRSDCLADRKAESGPGSRVARPFSCEQRPPHVRRGAAPLDALAEPPPLTACDLDELRQAGQPVLGTRSPGRVRHRPLPVPRTSVWAISATWAGTVPPLGTQPVLVLDGPAALWEARGNCCGSAIRHPRAGWPAAAWRTVPSAA